jgi:oligopeptide/dipeptide ABC transporter ATP-binding protein
MSALLEIDNLSVDLWHERAWRAVLRGVSLTVNPGEAVGIVGESGSGKSITARAVMRLLPQRAQVAGDVRFDGQSIAALTRTELLSWRAREVGMVFQDPRAHVNPVRRIGDFLTEGLVVARGVPRKEARSRVAGLLEATGIPDAQRRLGQYPHELSGGLLQRVMIAAALSTQPRLLIADEPTTALDVTTQSEVMAILNELRASHGMALVFITHDLDLAGAVCDRTAVMYAGRIVEVRTSKALHSDPMHPYSAALGASRPAVDSATPRLAAIPGRPISAADVSTACPFAPRCQYAQPRCETEVPALVELADGAAACHYAGEIHQELVATEEVSSHG